MCLLISCIIFIVYLFVYIVHLTAIFLIFLLMIRRPPRSTRTDNSFPTRRASELLPEAAISLKQGAGRLIRTERDWGVLMVGDARLVEKPYGKRDRKSTRLHSSH